ncbi:MAG TPA: nucleotide exchange factor GrpE [Acidimicrobiia bacterium]|nr:nucleotide exchange factor GrpE [Acidimicrobiia bacterium]
MTEKSTAPEEEVALLAETGDQLAADSLQQELAAATGESELPSDPQEAIAFLLDALRIAREEADSYLADLQRVAADFENFRKRTQREREDLVARSTQGMVGDLLPVLDSFDGALAAAEAVGDEGLLAGLQSTHQLLVGVLAREGLEAIPALGLPFDPALHEAVSGGGTGHLVVTAEMRRGYALRGRVIRPSLVGVAAEDPIASDPR